MKKLVKKWIPHDKLTKKKQKERDAKKRGFPIPPSQIHSSDKDYDRAKNREAIDDEFDSWEAEEI